MGKMAARDRLEKLETNVGQLSVLIDILLGRSGFDVAGVHTEVSRDIVETTASSDSFVATADGQQAWRRLLRARLVREH